jgi:hypothetical protein
MLTSAPPDECDSYDLFINYFWNKYIPANPSWNSFPFKYKPASFSDDSDVGYSDDDETFEDLLGKLEVKYQVT